MDITATFIKHVNVATPKHDQKPTNRNILRPTKKPPFILAAQEIMKNITELRLFIRENSVDYLDATNFIPTTSAKRLTEEQRSEIDREAHITIDKCYSGILSLEKHIDDISKDARLTTESIHHLGGVVECLKQKLGEVASFFRVQKTERHRKRIKDAEGYVKYNKATKTRKSPSAAFTSHKFPAADNSAVDISQHEEESVGNSHLEEGEKKLLEAENIALQQEFDTMVDQMKIVDSQLASVGNLLGELAFHVSAQKDTLSTVNKLAAEATQRVSKGNKELISATKKGVDFRVMVLLFLVVCSLSLLFLNWYED
jgi:syntaxin 18